MVMPVKYKITDFDKSIGVITVKVYDKSIDFETGFNITLPIIDGRYPDKFGIKELIINSIPFNEIQRIYDLKTDVGGGDDVVSLIDVEDSTDLPEVADVVTEMDVLVKNNEAIVRPIAAARLRFFGALTKAEQKDYMASYMAAIDEFHAKNPKWVRLGMVEKARLMNAFLPFETAKDQDVRLYNIRQMLIIAENT